MGTTLLIKISLISIQYYNKFKEVVRHFKRDTPKDLL